MTPLNSALTLYSMASVGFFDQEFYESIILQFKNKPCFLTELGYLSQAFAIGRLSEYTLLLIEKFSEIISNPDALRNLDEVWHLKDEFAFA